MPDKQVVGAVWNDLCTKSHSAYGWGQITGDIGMLFAPGAAVKAGGRLAEFSSALASKIPNALPGVLRLGTGGGEAGAVREFYTGGRIARQAAEDAARMEDGITLGMTKTGQGLSHFEQTVGYDAARPAIEAASAAFAQGARGEANVFINYLRWSDDSIWNTIERPILEANGLKINYVDVTPWEW
jgi:hypothetical protein